MARKKHGMTHAHKRLRPDKIIRSWAVGSARATSFFEKEDKAGYDTIGHVKLSGIRLSL